MEFDIRHNIADIRRWLSEAERKQLPFASALAMTWTAKDIQAEEIVTMKRVFDRPTPYTLNALRVVPARKTTLVAKVEFRDFGAGTPAKRFLNPEVHGGLRSRKAHETQIKSKFNMKGRRFAMPGRDMPRNAFGNIAGGTFQKILSQLKAQRDPAQNASGSAKSKGKRKKQGFFIPRKGRLSHVVFERKGDAVKPALVFTKPPRYPKRFPFYEVAGQVLRERLDANFERAFRQAMATSTVKSASTTMGIVGQYAKWTASAERASLFGS